MTANHDATDPGRPIPVPPNDPATTVRVRTPRDAYDAVELVHTRCVDHLGDDHAVTVLIEGLLDDLAGLNSVVGEDG